MRLFTLILAGLLALIQYPLWLGKGGWFRAWELDRQLVAQRATNERLRARNGALDGEVRDLKQGLVAVEERARYELGMIRADEFFVQLSGRPETAEAGGAAMPAPVAGVKGQLIVSDPGGADPSSANSSAASTASNR